jgi:hypothetical protein
VEVAVGDVVAASATLDGGVAVVVAAAAAVMVVVAGAADAVDPASCTESWWPMTTPTRRSVCLKLVVVVVGVICLGLCVVQEVARAQPLPKHYPTN